MCGLWSTIETTRCMVQQKPIISHPDSRFRRYNMIDDLLHQLLEHPTGRNPGRRVDFFTDCHFCCVHTL